MSSTSEDLTTRARIRDAAIHRFAAHGLDASLRSIAADAGVSAGLILHHFGSRAGLREACDEHVLAQIRDFKSSVLRSNARAAAMLIPLAGIEGYTTLVGYVLRALQHGGELTDRFVNASVDNTSVYVQEAVDDGVVRPSRAPAARARALTVLSLGALLLQLPGRQEHWDLEELPAMLRAYADTMTLPLLELYTEPLLTSPDLLAAYLATPDGARAAQEGRATDGLDDEDSDPSDRTTTTPSDDDTATAAPAATDPAPSTTSHRSTA
ncbi:TetR family transcriptional regulator [Georgenia sp. Z1491]|uniref:TetR family transcriptional regulator n=1 Tax=Georgenia sp. Z1491 TaxID=3416707 RepID=UPI003CE85D17